MKNPFRSAVPPIKRLQRIADEYDERGGENDTLQGALANAIVLIRAEANRNGLVNWSENYEECVELLVKYLCDDSAALPVAVATEIRRDLMLIREVGLQVRHDHANAYEQVDRVAERVLAWCEQHPRPIHKPSGQIFWYP